MGMDWSQPMCAACFAAWTLGRGEDPTRRQPIRLAVEPEPCLVCAGPNDGIYVRVDPALTSRLTHARRAML